MERFQQSVLKIKTLLSVGLFLLLAPCVKAQEPDWYVKLKQIQLTVSNRQEVERLFQFPKFKESSKRKGSQTVYYDLADGRLDVSYSTAKCSLDKNVDGYNFDEGIVIGIYFLLKKPISINNMKITLSDFEKYEEHDNDAWIYTNEDSGEQYIGGEFREGKTKIRSFEFTLPSGQEKQFDCRNVLKIANP